MAALTGMVLAAAAAGPASANAATFATTGNATSVTASGADLNGVAQPAAAGASWRFQYSQTPGFTAAVEVTAPVKLKRGLTVVERHVSGLVAGTTYYYRLLVESPQGDQTIDTFGATASLTTLGTTTASNKPYTLGVPPVPTDGRAKVVGTTLPVTRGSVGVLMSCGGMAGKPCRGTLAIGVRDTKGKDLLCGSARYAAFAPRSHSVAIRLSRPCLALVRSAKHHRLQVVLRVVFSTRQAMLWRLAVLAG